MRKEGRQCKKEDPRIKPGTDATCWEEYNIKVCVFMDDKDVYKVVYRLSFQVNVSKHLKKTICISNKMAGSGRSWRSLSHTQYAHCVLRTMEVQLSRKMNEKYSPNTIRTSNNIRFMSQNKIWTQVLIAPQLSWIWMSDHE